MDDRAERISAAWSEIISALGYDANDPHLVDSPDRVARFMLEWHTKTAEPPDVALFANDVGPAPVTVEGIAFHSICAHHGLPFFGTATVTYWPGDNLIGLSKVTRIVDHFAHRFGTQEQLGKSIAEHLRVAAGAKRVNVSIRAEHLCVSMRGVARAGQVTVTMYDTRG